MKSKTPSLFQEPEAPKIAKKEEPKKPWQVYRAGLMESLAFLKQLRENHDGLNVPLALGACVYLLTDEECLQVLETVELMLVRKL